MKEKMKKTELIWDICCVDRSGIDFGWFFWCFHFWYDIFYSLPIWIPSSAVVICFIFVAIQTPFGPNCFSFLFKRKFCVKITFNSRKRNLLYRSPSLSLSVLFTFRDVIDRNLFHEVSTQKHLLNDFKDCRCASVVSISDMFISFWLLLHTRTRIRTQSKKYNHFRWLMTRASFIGVTWGCCQVVKINSMCEYCV